MKERVCWIESRLEENDSSSILDWLLEQSPEFWGNMKEIQNDHITLIYGFKESSIEKVLNLVGNEHTMEVELSNIDVGKLNPSCNIIVKSTHMEALFWKIKEIVPECMQELINGKYIPHITICHLRKPISENILKNKQKLQGRKIKVTFVIKIGHEWK